jgi:beta-glucosidase
MRRLFALVASLIASVSIVACKPAEPPQLGKSPTKDVLAAMTTEEKVSLVIGAGMNTPGVTLSPEMQGPVLSQPIKGVPGAAGTTVPIPRLGIPAIILADGPAGLRIQPKRDGDAGTYYCTAFPIETLLASTWDVELLDQVGRAMGNEVYEYGVDVLLGPALNTHRNPLGGRNFEYYSEDPLVAGKMAAAMIAGVQSQGVGTSAKHFVANDHEWNRNIINVKASERALREIYLRPFEILVTDAQPWTIMSSYNRLNGAYTSENRALITGVVRNDWGFKGLVMTDWFGGRDAVAQMNAGNDLLEPGTAVQRKTLLAAVASGQLKMDVLDRNVERVLDLVLKSPTFKKAARTDKPDLAAHAKVGRDAAAQGMVLLKNNGALPVASSAKTLALFGDTSYAMITGGTGSGDVNEAYTVSMVEGLKAAGIAVDAKLAAAYDAYVADQIKKRPPTQAFMLPAPLPEMTVAPAEIARLAKETELGLVTIGRNSGEFRDRAREGDFELTADEKALIRAVTGAFHAQMKKTLVVLNVGGVVETVSWRDVPDAILLAWQPGQEAGHAIADVVTGKVAPSGKLATTFPMKYEDVPSSANFPGKTILGPDPAAPPTIFGRLDREAEIEYLDDIWVGYRHYATKGVKVAYPFGFGLSYTTFDYADLKLSAPEFGTGLTATVSIKNAGKLPGREVVQLYVSAPGKSLTLTFTITPRDLASFHEASSSWMAEAGTYTVKVGASSADIRKSATFTKTTEEKIATVSGTIGAGQ